MKPSRLKSQRILTIIKFALLMMIQHPFTTSVAANNPSSDNLMIENETTEIPEVDNDSNTSKGAFNHNLLTNIQHNDSSPIIVKDARKLFSPRMDYDQWKPIGRGDPLKNDPTYDYVPPVLDRVRYWIEPEMRKPEMHHPESKKSEILVLGVSSKKPSAGANPSDTRRDNFDYQKYMDNSKFHLHQNMFPRPNPVSRSTNQPPSNYYHNNMFYKHKQYDDHAFKIEEQRVPYTILMPPPIQQFYHEMAYYKPMPSPPPSTTLKPSDFASQTTTLPSVSVQEANLIFQSSSLEKDWEHSKHPFGADTADSHRVTWKTPANSDASLQSPYISTEGPTLRIINNSSNSIDIQMENKPIHIFDSSISDNRPNKGVVFPSSHIVFEKPDNIPSTVVFPSNTITNPVMQKATEERGTYLNHLPGPLNIDQNMQVLHVSDAVATLAQISVGSQAMHKGQVTDETIEASYVNIAKPNAQLQPIKVTTENVSSKVPQISLNKIYKNHSTFGGSSMMTSMMKMPLLPTVIPKTQSNSVHSNSLFNYTIKKSPVNNISKNNFITNDHTLQLMQTMQPPPLASTEPSTTIYRKPDDLPMFSRKPSGLLHSLLQKETTHSKAPIYTSTTPLPTTSSITTLTTDPLFKHYKQPMEPMKGPMYLIIQGHSKVKTYGASNKKPHSEPSPQETNEVSTNQDRYSVKHLHKTEDSDEREIRADIQTRSKNGRSLQQLVSNGVGSLEIQETNLGIKYDVSAGDAIPIEVYRKGIVETEQNELLQQRRKSETVEREKRQLSLEDLIPVEEEDVDAFVFDYLKSRSEGSGVGALVASAITSDAASVIDVLEDDDDDEDEDEDEDEDDS